MKDQLMIVLEAWRTMCLDLPADDTKDIFLETLKHVILKKLGRMPTLREQKEATAAFYLDLMKK